MIYQELWEKAARRKRAASPIHGLVHWQTVRENGLFLAGHNGADPDVVELFALFHDSCRWTDSLDPWHGPRAAEWVASMRADLVSISDELFQYLLEAIRDHTHVKHTDNIHIAACWDADRLDVSRVGLVLKPDYFNTEKGRSIAQNGGSIRPPARRP